MGAITSANIIEGVVLGGALAMHAMAVALSNSLRDAFDPSQRGA